MRWLGPRHHAYGPHSVSSSVAHGPSAREGRTAGVGTRPALGEDGRPGHAEDVEASAASRQGAAPPSDAVAAARAEIATHVRGPQAEKGSCVMNGPVVVGVDGSPSSLAAVETAAREAALRGVGLRLVHAFGWPSLPLPPGGTAWGPSTARVRELADRTLTRAERRAHRVAPHVRIVTDSVVGEPVMVLEIESRTASLLVVGSRGLSRFGSLLLGSTAGHLAAHGRCPLLVVRGRPDPSGPVLLAVDGSPASRPAVEFAFAEAELRAAPLVAQHVWNTATERVYDGPADPPFVTYDEDRLRDEEERLLAEAVSGLQEKYPDVAVERRLVRGHVRGALVEASAEAQLAVVGARGHGGFTGLLLGSVGQALLHHAHCPVAVIHSGRE